MREKIKLESSAGTGHFYTTTKNKRTIPEKMEICVNDSTANLRYMVLPLRPKGTENYSEEQLEALVTRDAMIGVKLLQVQ